MSALQFFRRLRARRVLTVAALPLAIAGYSAIPASGPTGVQVRSQVKTGANQPGSALVGLGHFLKIAIHESGIGLFERAVPAITASEINFESSGISRLFALNAL